MYIEKTDHGLLLYENRNDHRKLLIPVLMDEENKEKLEGVFNWCRQVLDAYNSDELPENIFRSNAKECKTCPLRKTCFAAPAGTVRLEKLTYG